MCGVWLSCRLANFVLKSARAHASQELSLDANDARVKIILLCCEKKP